MEIDFNPNGWDNSSQKRRYLTLVYPSVNITDDRRNKMKNDVTRENGEERETLTTEKA